MIPSTLNRRPEIINHPVVMYRCESWTIKKAEGAEKLMFLNCGVGEDS